MILEFLVWVWSQNPFVVSLIILAWAFGVLAAFCVQPGEFRRSASSALEPTLPGPIPDGGQPTPVPAAEESLALESADDDTVVRLDKYRAS